MKVTQNPSPNTQPIESPKNQQRASNVRPGIGKTVTGTDSAEVELSDDAKMMKSAVDTVRATPDKRADKIAALKKQIQEGTYRTDAGKIADKLVDEHLFGDFGKNRV